MPDKEVDGARQQLSINNSNRANIGSCTTDRDVWQLKLIKVKDNSNVHSVDGGQALESRGRRLA
jgi:hypothetical protein